MQRDTQETYIVMFTTGKLFWVCVPVHLTNIYSDLGINI